MTTWRVGDSWVTFSRNETGIGSNKARAQAEASERRQQRYCTGCGEVRQAGCGSRDCTLVEVSG